MVVIDYKYLGYFPTINLLKILPLFDGNEKARICKLSAFRSWLTSKTTGTPFSYLKLTDFTNRDIKIDYNYLRHGDLDPKTLIDAIAGAGASLVVTEELGVMLPSKVVFEEEAEKKGWEKRNLVATFVEHFAKAPDKEYRKTLERHMNREELVARIKHSSLDLMSLQEARFWARGSRRGYYKEYKEGIMEDLHPIRCIMRAIDPDGALGRWRQYKRGKADAWILSADRSILEE